jgi:hypothetical protein
MSMRILPKPDGSGDEIDEGRRHIALELAIMLKPTSAKALVIEARTIEGYLRGDGGGGLPDQEKAAKIRLRVFSVSRVGREDNAQVRFAVDGGPWFAPGDKSWQKWTWFCWVPAEDAPKAGDVFELRPVSRQPVE